MINIQHAHILSSVNEFYQQNPFPGYDIAKYCYAEDLRDRASWFGLLLDDQIAYDAKILDAGCGTGQLANFLALKGRSVLGVDYSLKSLQKAQALKERLGLASVRFQRMNLLEPDLEAEGFDVVMSMGVLHHTPDPCLGFQNLVRATRSGGMIIVGLYNTWGRLPVRFRRYFKKHFQALRIEDRAVARQLAGDSADIEKSETWLADQYHHPHESCHTIAEVLDWFGKNGIDYINSLPPTEWWRKTAENYKLFETPDVAAWRKSRCAQYAVQIKWISSLKDNGGYFITIGQKR